jgi:hypothetical protein
MAIPAIYPIFWHPICPSKWSGHLTDQIFYNLKTVWSKRAVRWQPLTWSIYRLFSSKSSPPSARNSLTPSRTAKYSRNQRGRPASGWRAFQIACECPKGTHRRPTEYFRIPNNFEIRKDIKGKSMTYSGECGQWANDQLIFNSLY